MRRDERGDESHVSKKNRKPYSVKVQQAEYDAEGNLLRRTITTSDAVETVEERVLS